MTENGTGVTKLKGLFRALYGVKITRSNGEGKLQACLRHRQHSFILMLKEKI